MILCVAMILDALLGEPRWLWSRLPHPAVMIGNAIAWITKRLNQGRARRAKGFFLVFTLVLGGAIIGLLLSQLGWVIEIFVVAILLAQKSLVDHVAAVASGLRMSLTQGRFAVSMIVGRDTNAMTPPQVARGAIESGAENFSDGFIAPAFWFLLAGLPGILIYKAINTADSMVGYKTPELAEFGFAAARLDDVLNWIPARLSAVLILATTGGGTAWGDIKRDARLHRSPNAGWPEAAMARVLNLSLSGPRSYEGSLQDFPWVHPAGRKNASAGDIDDSVKILWRAWCGALALWAITSILFSLPGLN